MGVYGNMVPTEEILTEGIIVLDEMAAKEFYETIKNWKTQNERHGVNRFISNSISDEDYTKLKEIIDQIKATDDYAEYKKLFSRFCYYCNIAPRGVIFRKWILKRGKAKDKNSLEVEYVNNSKKVTLPEGVKLYHMSKVGGIKELIPQFKGKSERGYIYDKPRVYFTIRRNMPKFLADYKASDKLHMYLCKKDIREVYIDPLVWSWTQGAVYVETTTPIPVEEITDMSAAELKALDKDEEKVEESFDVDGFFDFVSESGLIIESMED